MQTTLQKNMPSIVIADQDPISLNGIKYFINSHLGNYNVIEANSTGKLKEIIKTNAATHLIADMELAENGNTHLFDSLRKTFPGLQIMVYNLTSHEVESKIKNNLQADYFLPCESSEKEIIGALTYFLKKGNSSNSADQKQMNDGSGLAIKSPFDKLSDREKIALDYLLKGYRTKTIAVKMQVKSNTATTFKHRIFKKLMISNTIDLYKISQSHGLSVQNNFLS
jgi:DNA-binding NarL/FixJ family response regulator